MSAPPPLGGFGDGDPGVLLWARGCVVEMPDAALGDHGFDLAVEGGGESIAEVHLRGGGFLDDGGVEEDLVGGAEGEVELVLEHEFAVDFGSFSAHVGVVVGGWWCERERSEREKLEVVASGWSIIFLVMIKVRVGSGSGSGIGGLD